MWRCVSKWCEPNFTAYIDGTKHIFLLWFRPEKEWVWSNNKAMLGNTDIQPQSVDNPVCFISRDARIDRSPIEIGRYSLSTDRSVLSKHADRESRSNNVKYMTLLCARQNKLAKMASPVWHYLKVSENDNKIAVQRVWSRNPAAPPAVTDRWAKHTRVRPNTLSYLIYLWN